MTPGWSDNGRGFTLTPAYDSAARLKSLTSSWSDAQHPANLLTVDATAGYTPAGALAKMTYGNGLVETSTYNNRLQPTQLRTYNPTNSTDVLNLTYGFTDSAGSNNGNVVTFNSSATQIFMRTYTYDELNRLSTMSSPADASGCYGLSWAYDAWGNRLSQTPTSGGCVSPSYTLNAANRIIDPGFIHDSSGNMTHDASHAYTFDAENRISTVDSGAASYLYDANGKRVRKTANGVTTDYVNDPAGSFGGEMQGSTWTKGYAYASGHLLAQYNGVLGASGATTLFTHTDHLGSSRALTTVAGGVSDSMDYLPYGELLAGGSSTTHRFTGVEHDPESGLDAMGARYFGSSVGRFMTSDPIYLEMGRLANPQALNLYTYVLNNPLNLTDPSGLDEKLQCQSDDKKCSGKTLQNLTNNLNSRKNAAFKVKLGKDGVLRVQGKVDPSKLNRSEEMLYHAITDKDHHATLNVVSASDQIQFDKFNGHGQNTIDASDMGLLASQNQEVAGHILAHAAVEAYVSAAYGVDHYRANGNLGLGPGAHDVASNFYQEGEASDHIGYVRSTGDYQLEIKVPDAGVTIYPIIHGTPPHRGESPVGTMTSAPVRKDQ